MPYAKPSRRSFLALATAAALHRPAGGQVASIAHKSVADLDGVHILTEAKAALGAPVQPPPAPVFHTEAEPNLTTAGALPAPTLERTAALALQSYAATLASLAAGFLLTHDEAYAQRAVAHTRAWLLEAATALQPHFEQAGCPVGSAKGSPAGVLDLTPLAEAARALSFLTDNFTPEELVALKAWFQQLLVWLSNDRAALIARDAKDRRASAALLITAAAARFVQDEAVLEDARKRFRKPTLRNQIRADGVFPQEVATPNPYRNTLFNFDLLAGACQLLSSPFDALWDFELIDGVGLRAVAAYLYPVIEHPERWGYPADAQFFRELPGRRPALLFAGRAYSRPEYVETWQRLPPTPPASLAASFPIRQPILWTARAPHGL